MTKATFLRTESGFRIIEASGKSREASISDMGGEFTRLGITEGEAQTRILRLTVGQSVIVDDED
jgi:hypothetical protein